MERSPNPHAPEVAHNFLVDAIKDGAIDKYKAEYHHDTSARNLNILGLYRGTFLSQTALAHEASITRERARKIILKTTNRLWELCSPEIQSKYPRAEVLACGEKTTPPLFVRPKELKNSQKPDHVSRSITPIQFSKTTEQQIRIAKQKGEALSKRQKKVQDKEVWQKIKKTIRESSNFNHVQDAFDILDFTHAKDLTSGDNSTVISFTKLFGNSPIRHSEKIYKTLRKQGFPILKIKHNFKRHHPHLDLFSYYVPRNISQQITDFAKSSEIKHLLKAKVLQISGPQVEVPTTHTLQNSDLYRGVFTLNTARKIRSLMRKNPSFSSKELFDEIPYVVFKVNRGYACLRVDHDKIAEIVEQRLGTHLTAV